MAITDTTLTPAVFITSPHSVPFILHLLQPFPAAHSWTLVGTGEASSSAPISKTLLCSLSSWALQRRLSCEESSQQGWGTCSELPVCSLRCSTLSLNKRAKWGGKPTLVPQNMSYQQQQPFPQRKLGCVYMYVFSFFLGVEVLHLMLDFGTWCRKIIETPIAKFSSIQSQKTQVYF